MVYWWTYGRFLGNADLESVIIWTDGSAFNSGDRSGGWAYLIEKDEVKILEEAGYIPDTTSSRMEMTAALSALKSCKELGFRDVEIRSDSSYVVNCFRQGWYHKWKRSRWINSQGKDVLNRDLWESLIDLHEDLGVTWIHVKGHIGTPNNERCDYLAGQARKRKAKVKMNYEKGF